MKLECSCKTSNDNISKQDFGVHITSNMVGDTDNDHNMSIHYWSFLYRLLLGHGDSYLKLWGNKKNKNKIQNNKRNGRTASWKDQERGRISSAVPLNVNWQYEEAVYVNKLLSDCNLPAKEIT